MKYEVGQELNIIDNRDIPNKLPSVPCIVVRVEPLLNNSPYKVIFKFCGIFKEQWVPEEMLEDPHGGKFFV